MKLIKKISTVIILLTAIHLCSCVSLVEKFYPDETDGDSKPAFVPVEVEEGSVYFKDFDGNVITLEEAPKKVVSLSTVSTEILCGLGAGRYIIAVNESSSKLEDAPIAAEVLPDYYSDPQRLTELEPDIIFYDSSLSYLVIPILQDAGLTLVRIPDKGNISTAESNIRFLASLMFRDTAGELMIREMRDEIKKLSVVAELISMKKRVYIESTMSFNAYGGDCIVSELCGYIGCENIFEDKTGTYITSASELREKAPDAIIVLSNDTEKFSADTVSKREGMQDVYAVRLKAIYAIDYKTATRPTQNITKALKSIAQALKVTK